MSDRVAAGDILTHVDDIEIAKLSTNTVEKMLGGARNSTVTVSIYNVRSKQEIVLELRRHVPPREDSTVTRLSPPGKTGGSGSPSTSEPVTDFEVAGRTLPPKPGRFRL